MSVEYKAAVLALFAGFPHTFYPNGQVPNKPSFPYLVLRMDTGTDSVEKLCGVTDKTVFRFYLTSVGLTDDSARIVAADARARVKDKRIVVAGAACNPIRKQSTLPLQPDTDMTDSDTNLHPTFTVETYRIPSHSD